MRGMKVAFLNHLDMREIHEGIFQLINPFYVGILLDDGKEVEVIIPEGFTTDLCSVPRIPFAYLLFGGKGNRAGVLHDALYSPWTEIKVLDKETRERLDYDREWADTVLYFALETCGVGELSRRAMYTGVRIGGEKHYKPKAQQDLAIISP
jgi:hypothetical protein